MYRVFRLFPLWTLFLLWSFGVNCTCEQGWNNLPGEANTACNPTASQHPDAKTLVSLLNQKDEGAAACLQLGWGDEFVTQSDSQLVWIKPDGSLYTLENGQQQAPNLTLPKNSQGKMCLSQVTSSIN